MNNVVEQKLWSLAGPIFVELILSITLLVTDTFFLSKVSDVAAASIGAALAVISVCIFFFEALAQGAVSVASQYLGAKRDEDASTVYAASLFLSLLVGLILSVFFIFWHKNVSLWLGFKSNSLQYVSTYLWIIGSMMIIQAVKFFYSSVISSVGKTNLNMIVTIIANIINIVLNCIFILGIFGNLNLKITGVARVALATVISYAAAVCILAFIVHYQLKIVFGVKKFLADFKRYTYSILSIAAPSALEPVSYHLSHVCVSIMIIQLGDIAMGAKVYAFNISYINFVWYYAIALGTQILVAHMAGAKLFAKADKLLHKSVGQGVLGSLILTGLIFIAGRFLLSLFTKNEAIIKLGTALLAIGIIFGILATINTIISFSLRAAGDAKYTSFMGIIVMWIIGIPLCYCLGIYLKFGMVGILIGMTIDEFIRAILNFRRWRLGVWKRRGVTNQEECVQVA